ncbi:pyrimidine reductase family protein [Nakamurella leprariae]|uniref:Pyrimidine reductase family protein n=1 Tax=Nakamurella leprariae TaxID=2803911 RepID=A0A938YAL5_9ACTN|nr:pyrimidine reductase family protein [Nakamurella leprariae]MBM9467072.1 pyrimidine reductase family protein [Nakamurella leprariae]
MLPHERVPPPPTTTPTDGSVGTGTGHHPHHRRHAPDPARDRPRFDDDGLAHWYRWPARVTQQPVVRATMIVSLDGMATLDGRSGGLGGPADERRFTLLRDLADVVLVGSGTARAEHYGGIRLNDTRARRRARWGLGVIPPPLAVVTGRGLPADSPVFTDTVTPPIIVTTDAAAASVPADSGARVLVAGTDRVDLTAVIVALAGLGLHRISCEGGPALLAGLLAADLLDELCLTVAPLLAGPGGERLLPADAVPAPGSRRWQLRDRHDEDDLLFLRYRREHGPGAAE